MAFITAATRSDIVELAMGMLNQAPSTTLLNTLIEKSTAGSSIQDLADYIATTDAFTTEYPSTQTAREFATEMFAKLITGGTLDAAINTAVIDLLEGMLTAGTTKAEGFVAVIDYLSNTANNTNADLGDIAKSFQNRADAAEYFSITKELGDSTAAELAAAISTVTSDAATLTAANAAADATAVAADIIPGSTITLTTGLDLGTAFTGGTGDDTFSSIETAVTTPATDTYTTGDSVDGGAGTDTLVVNVAGSPVGNTTAGVATVNVEALSVFNNSTASADYTVDAALMVGVTDVYINGGSEDTIISNIPSTPNLHLLSTARDTTVTATATAVAGDATAVTVATNATALTSSATATYNGVETMNLAVGGVTGTGGLTNYRLNLVSDALETINVTGSSDAYVAATFSGSVADSQTSTFDASAATGNVTVDFTRGASATSAITMGAGNDTVDFASTLSEKDVIVGGEGTDTLEIGGTNDYGTTAATQDNGSGISGFELLKLKSGAVVDARILTANSGLNNVTFEAGGSYTDSTVTDVTNLASGTVVLDLLTDGATDSLNYTSSGVGAISSTLTALDMETINVTTGGLGDTTLTISGATADVTKVVATGTQTLGLTVAGTSIATVDASGVSGLGESFTLTATASTAAMTVTPSGVTPSDVDTDTANTITTGSGADKLTGTAYIDILTGGAGADTITGGGGVDQLNGGSGNDSITGGSANDAISDGSGDDVVVAGDGIDTITLGTGSDNIDGGAGNDVITAGSNLTGGDTIAGGTGTDSLTATISGAGIAPTISGVESISIGFGASTFIDMANVTDITALTVDSSTAGGAAAQVKNLISGATVTVTDEASLAGAGNITTLTVDTVADASVTVKVAANKNAATDAAAALTGFTFTDAATVAITNVGGSVDNVLDHQIAGNLVLDDTDTTSLTLTSSAYGSLDFVANLVTNSSSLKDVTLTAATYGDITFDTLADIEEVQNLTITASGVSADVNLGIMGGGTASTALSTISATATGGGTIDFAAITANANLSTVTVSADGTNSSVIPTGALTTTNGGISAVTVTSTDRGNVDMTAFDMTVGSGLVGAFTASATGRGTIDLNGFASTSTSTTTGGTYSVSTGTRGSITMGNANISTNGSLTAINVVVGEDSTLDGGTGVISALLTVTDTVLTVEADATTSNALVIGEVGTTHTDAIVTLSADATNGGTFDLVGDVFTALDFVLDGSSAITIFENVDKDADASDDFGSLELTYDGTAGAVDVYNNAATDPTITLLTINASSSTGTNDIGVGMASKLVYTGGSGADTVGGTAGADNMTTSAGNDNIGGQGRTETVVIGSNTNGETFISTINGTAVTTTVANQATTAIATAHAVAINAANSTMQASATVTGSTVTIVYDNYLGTAGATTGTGTSTDAITVGSGAGDDTVNSGAGDDKIFMSSGEDSITTGTGSDDVYVTGMLLNTGLSTASSANTLTATMAVGDTITFGNGVDVITDFTSGTDDLVVSAATATLEGIVPTELVGATAGDLAEDTVHSTRGNFVSSTGVFTFSATGTDLLVAINDGTGVDDVLSTNTNVMILTGVTALVAGDLI